MDDSKKKSDKAKQGFSGGFYAFGWIGAMIYYISHAASFGEGVIGFLKALVWPVFLVYQLFEHLGM